MAMPLESDAESIDRLRKKLGFRAWHRGTREADLLLGRFADRYLRGFTAEQLNQFADLLCENDPDIYDWLIGRTPVPAVHDTEVMRLLRAHYSP